MKFKQSGENSPGPAASSVPQRAFSIEDAAKMLGVSQKTIRRLIQRGKLRVVPYLRIKRIPQQQIETLLK